MTKQELIEKILDGWTDESFCHEHYAYDKLGKPTDPLGAEARRARKIISFDKVICELLVDFKSKYGQDITDYNDSHSFAELKEALERLYVKEKQ